MSFCIADSPMLDEYRSPSVVGLAGKLHNPVGRTEKRPAPGVGKQQGGP